MRKTNRKPSALRIINKGSIKQTLTETHQEIKSQTPTKPYRNTITFIGVFHWKTTQLTTMQLTIKTV